MHEPDTYKTLKNGKATDPETIYEIAKQKIQRYEGLAQRCRELAQENAHDYDKLTRYAGIAARAREYAHQYKKALSMCLTEGTTEKGDKATAFFQSFEDSLSFFYKQEYLKGEQKTIDFTKYQRRR